MGLITFLVAAAATGWSVRASFERPRGVAVAFGLLAALLVLVALCGLLLVFVPAFFS